MRDSDSEINSVMDIDCWTPCDSFGLASGSWTAETISTDLSHFQALNNSKVAGKLRRQLIVRHNAENALAAIAAANHVGAEPQLAISAMTRFKSVKRRLQKLTRINGMTIYDDFAHHPTSHTNNPERFAA